jgi:hypothetical protein
MINQLAGVDKPAWRVASGAPSQCCVIAFPKRGDPRRAAASRSGKFRATSADEGWVKALQKTHIEL